VNVCLSDPNLARELNTRKRAGTIEHNRVRSPALKRMRKKLRSPAGRSVYGHRKTLVELVFGVLKDPRQLSDPLFARRLAAISQNQDGDQDSHRAAATRSSNRALC
jgi:hypothetical protein